MSESGLHLDMRQVVAGDNVPERYRGVWRRTLLAAPGVHDTTTTVFWMQASRWHADLRVPSGRPDFSAVSTLAQCSAEQCAWLAGQQGFAGITDAFTDGETETCTWHRQLDFQFPGTTPDAGTMKFEAQRLIEEGVHASYLEHWTKLPASDQGFAVLERIGAAGLAVSPRELMLVAGKFVMHVRDRKASWPVGMQAGADLKEASQMGSAALLDMEISFGCRTPTGWKILHSLFPWLENKSFTIKIIREDMERVEWECDGVHSSWRKIEWTVPA